VIPLEPVGLAEIQAARARIAGVAVRTPLVPLHVDGAPARIWLKLENLQPIGSFKLRGAGNAMKLADRTALERGVWTASAGNMAQGVAWMARTLGVRCRVVVPDHAPKTKLEAIERLGGEWVAVPFAEWWGVIETGVFRDFDGVFVHPVCDPHVLAGNATIGLEIAEDLPEVDTVLVPYGGGALSAGIACALRAVKPGVRVFGCEVETSAALAAAFAAGRPTAVEYRASFVDGIGSKGVLEALWPLVSRVLAGAQVVTLRDVADAVRLLALRNRVIAEGAGATPVAAALAGKGGTGNVVCVVSGGNLDASKLSTILAGDMP